MGALEALLKLPVPRVPSPPNAGGTAESQQVRAGSPGSLGSPETRRGASAPPEDRRPTPAVLMAARTARAHPCRGCGNVYFAAPAVLCYWCRRQRDDTPVGEPCPGCGEACERCTGDPAPDAEAEPKGRPVLAPSSDNPMHASNPMTRARARATPPPET